MKGLYAIIDPEHCLGRDPLWVAEQVLRGGCAALQLRAKTHTDAARLALARALASLCAAAHVPFWMNDRVDLALLSDAAGVHLGQDDLPLPEARRLWPDRQLGLSTHSREQALAAAAAGADVIGFGPIFTTSSKLHPSPCVGLELLREVSASAACPVIAIGGIELAHAPALVQSGASYAAVIGAVCRADDPREAARALHDALLQR
jgi:thiamine-phosphate pyrophosphorylase